MEKNEKTLIYIKHVNDSWYKKLSLSESEKKLLDWLLYNDFLTDDVEYGQWEEPPIIEF